MTTRSLVDLPDEILEKIFQTAGRKSFIFIALTCRKFYNIVKWSPCLGLITNYKDIFSTDNIKNWALNILDEKLSPIIIHSFYKHGCKRNGIIEYNTPIFHYDNYKFEGANPLQLLRTEMILNSFMALFVICGKKYCSSCTTDGKKYCLCTCEKPDLPYFRYKEQRKLSYNRQLAKHKKKYETKLVCYDKCYPSFTCHKNNKFKKMEKQIQNYYKNNNKLFTSLDSSTWKDDSKYNKKKLTKFIDLDDF